jgi:hypothetical protein
MGLLATALMMCTALGAGCGGPPAVQATARPASHFAIAFERSGGLKASVETLVVRPGLRARATGPKGNRRASTRFRMRARTAEELRRQLARARFAQIPSTATPGSCADCYVYEIRYRGHDVAFSDATLPQRLRPVVIRMEALIEAHLPLH